MKNNIFINRYVMACAISIVLALVGFISMSSLPIEQYPNIAPPQVEVTAYYMGADPKTIIQSVISPLEESINGVAGMDYMVSKATSTGTATIDVYFKQGVDPDIATVNVQNRVSKAQSQLPSAVVNMGIETEKRQSSILRIIGVRCTNGKYSDDFVSNYVDINIKPRMQRIFGVGSVTSLGNTYALRVWMKPDVLAQYGLTPDDISTAINSQSFVTSLGKKWRLVPRPTASSLISAASRVPSC